MMPRGVLWLLSVAGLLSAENFTYWVQPCTAEVARESTCDVRDPELAEWALTAWQKTARADLALSTATEARARIRVYWASSRMRLYGEAHPIMVDGKRGAAIYVNPDVRQLGDEIDAATSGDRLLRDAIVYLTCLHESGHALGLAHTGRFEDIMYSFGYGGDIVEYFERYRRKIATRAEIREHSGISDRDRERLLELYRKRQ
jgi:Matrixin